MRSYKYIVILEKALVLSYIAAQCGVTVAKEERVVETVVVEKEVVKEVEKVVEVPAEETDLVYMTAGDVNMLSLAQNLLAA